MANTRLVRVDESLIDVFGRVGKSFADKVKREYNLNELFVPDTLASQIIAGKYKGQKMFEFKVEKTGLNKGKLILIK